MTLVHLKIEKYRISRPRPIDGSDLVLTEWTPHRKSTHKMKNRSWVCRFPELLLQFYSACGAPMPCAAGSSIYISLSDLRWVGNSMGRPQNLSIFFSPGVFVRFSCSKHSESIRNRKSIHFCIENIWILPRGWEVLIQKAEQKKTLFEMAITFGIFNIFH